MAAREGYRLGRGKRAGRVASEGSVGSYIHAGGKLGVLVEVNCETDFFAKSSEKFQTLVKDIAMQIAATNPRCVQARGALRRRARAGAPDLRLAEPAAASPQQVIAKIVEGKLEKFLQEACLMEQSWVKDPNKTITDLIGEFTGKIGREDRDSALRPLPARRRGREPGPNDGARSLNHDSSEGIREPGIANDGGGSKPFESRTSITIACS